MKTFFKTLSAALLVFALVFSVSLAKDNVKVDIKTSAYSWMCKNKIESNINKMDGVNDCELDLSTKTLTVKYDESKVTTDKIVKKIEDLGYDAEIKHKKEN